jgi:hypothetical protein
MPKLTLTIRDDETGFESKSYLDVFDNSERAVIAQVARSVSILLGEIGYGEKRMGGSNDKLDHDQDQSDSMIKSVNPDAEFMKSEGLCGKCHGPANGCGRRDCPHL